MGSLHNAARAGDADAAAAAIAADASSITATDKLNRTPLHLAAWAGHSSMVDLLIEAGADVHAAAMDGICALHFAAQQGHEDACKALLKGGAKVNARDTKKLNSALHAACAKGLLENSGCCEEKSGCC